MPSGGAWTCTFPATRRCYDKQLASQTGTWSILGMIAWFIQSKIQFQKVHDFWCMRKLMANHFKMVANHLEFHGWYGSFTSFIHPKAIVSTSSRTRNRHPRLRRDPAPVIPSVDANQTNGGIHKDFSLRKSCFPSNISPETKNPGLKKKQPKKPTLTEPSLKLRSRASENGWLEGFHPTSLWDPAYFRGAFEW